MRKRSKRTPRRPAASDSCVRDDSTECDCPRCAEAEERFWYEQGDREISEAEQVDDPGFAFGGPR